MFVSRSAHSGAFVADASVHSSAAVDTSAEAEAPANKRVNATGSLAAACDLKTPWLPDTAGATSSVLQTSRPGAPRLRARAVHRSGRLFGAPIRPKRAYLHILLTWSYSIPFLCSIPCSLLLVSRARPDMSHLACCRKNLQVPRAVMSLCSSFT